MRYLLLFLLTLITSVPAYGVDPFESLQARYLSLRNTDVQTTKQDQWRILAGNFESYVKKNSKSPNVGQALFNAAIVYEELWRNHKAEADYQKAMSIFESIPRDFPGDSFADDALIRVGDLWAARDKTEAKKRYLEVAEAYPDGDMVDVAEAKLKVLRRGGSSSKRRKSVDKSMPLIIVDPGHGGEDLGAKGQGGLNEKDIVLDVAIRLENIAKEEDLYQVRLTRRSDIFVPLVERTNLANDFDANLFISLHVNSAPVRTFTGLETYYLDNTDDKSSLALAERENQFFEQTGGVSDINFILSDLIQSSKLEGSIILANILQSSLKSHLEERWGSVRSNGVKKAPFYVLVGTHVPGALVEMMFINNPKEEKLLSQTGVRQNLAEGLNEGIKAFLQKTGKIK
jgi:N-acetylmuramoyl-L-alanine amidase